MERKRMTMGEAAQIRYKSALPPMVYHPPLAAQFGLSLSGMYTHIAHSVSFSDVHIVHLTLGNDYSSTTDT